MTDKKCPNKATCIYPWAGKIKKACQTHTRAMVALASQTNQPIEANLLPQGEFQVVQCEHPDDLAGITPGKKKFKKSKRKKK